MSDEALTVGSIDLGNLLPIKSGNVLVPVKKSCRECVFAAMEGGDRVCRRNPPQVTYIMVPEMKAVVTPQGPRQQQVMAIRNFSGFPVVQNEQWCGHFSPKERS